MESWFANVNGSLKHFRIKTSDRIKPFAISKVHNII